MSQLISQNIIIATNLNYDRDLRFEAWSTIGAYSLLIYIIIYLLLIGLHYECIVPNYLIIF